MILAPKDIPSCYLPSLTLQGDLENPVAASMHHFQHDMPRWWHGETANNAGVPQKFNSSITSSCFSLFWTPPPKQKNILQGYTLPKTNGWIPKMMVWKKNVSPALNMAICWYLRFLGDFSLWRCRWPFGLQREKAAPGAKWSQPQLGIQWRWHQKTRPCQTQLPGLISELQENQQGSLPLWLDGKNSVTDFGNRNFRTLHLGPSKAMILCTERSSILKWSCLGLILLWCLTNTESCWSGSSRCCNSVLDAWCLKSCWACRHLLCTICIVYTEMIHPLKMQLRRNRSRKGLFQKKKKDNRDNRQPLHEGVNSRNCSGHLFFIGRSATPLTAAPLLCPWRNHQDAPAKTGQIRETLSPTKNTSLLNS